jgi:hypothetical protein
MGRRGIPVTASSWPTRVPGFPGPATIEDSAVIMTPLEDSGVFRRLQTLFVEADNQRFVYFAGPQGRKLWYVAHAAGWHTHNSNHAHSQVVLQHPSLVVTVPIAALRDTQGATAAASEMQHDKVVVPAPFIVHPPWTLGFETSSAPPIGEKVRIRILYVELDQGEVLPQGP